MKNHLVYLLLFILLITFPVNSQIIKNDTKIRFELGLAGFSSEDINQFFTKIEDFSEKVFPETDFSLGRFEDHIYFSLEYESELGKSISYLISFEHHNDHLSGSDVDYVKSVSQNLNFDFTFFTAGLSLVYYHSAFNVALGEARVFAGLGVDIVYTNVDLKHYYNSVIKGGIQELDLNSTGYSYGGKAFFGLEAPFLENIYVQVRLGYSDRIAKDFSNKFEFNKSDPFPPTLFEKDSYNISGLWGNLGLAYYF